MHPFPRWPMVAGAFLAMGAVVAQAEAPATLVGSVTLRNLENASASGGAAQGGTQEPIIVYVEGYDAEPTTPLAPKTVSQAGLSFFPNLVGVVRGQEVRFQNDDGVAHNIFSTDPAFDLGHYKKEWKSHRFTSPGVVQIFCNVHPQMAAWVVVLKNPQFALTDSAGNYRIEGVPPGQWRVVAWHPRAHPEVATKAFTPGSTVKWESSLTANVPLAEHRDKWSGHYDRFLPDGGYHQW
jgi:plastocyanin